MTVAIVAGVASVLLGDACASCWRLMRRAAREGHADAVVLKLTVASFATLVAALVALVVVVAALDAMWSEL